MARQHVEQEAIRLMGIISLMMEDQRGQGRDPNDWLQTLYENYERRFLSDNNVIWSTGAILIPLSLAGFGAVLGRDQVHWTSVAVFLFASSLLMLIWNLIADTHRAFQEKSEAWLVAIERTIKLESVSDVKIFERGSASRLTRLVPLRRIRWTLLWVVLAGWGGVLILTLTDPV